MPKHRLTLTLSSSCIQVLRDSRPPHLSLSQHAEALLMGYGSPDQVGAERTAHAAPATAYATQQATSIQPPECDADCLDLPHWQPDEFTQA